MIQRTRLGAALDYQLRKHNETQQQLADAIGVSKSAVSAWVVGDRFPRLEAINDICTHFGISTEDLLGLKKSIQIPILGRVHAGQTTYANEEILGYVDIAPENQEDLFCLYVEGDSMLPELHDRDLVIVRKQSILEDGDIGVFSIGDNETSIKQYQKLNRHIVLTALNEDYESWMYSFQEVDELPVLILGKVVEARRRYV